MLFDFCKCSLDMLCEDGNLTAQMLKEMSEINHFSKISATTVCCVYTKAQPSPIYRVNFDVRYAEKIIFFVSC